MKYALIVIVAFATVFTLNHEARSQVFENFDTNDGGWTVSGDATSTTPDYLGDGGNPSGHITIDDTATGGVWYWEAPSTFEGDLSVATNLVFDLFQSSTSAQFDREDVFLEGAGLILALDTSFNPDTDWTSYSIALDESSPWQLNDLNGVLATDLEIQQVLEDVDRLRIRGEFVDGPDFGGLDNVGLVVVSVPEPNSAILFLALMATRAVSLRHRTVA